MDTFDEKAREIAADALVKDGEEIEINRDMLERHIAAALREADRAAREDCAEKCDAKARVLAEDAVLRTRNKMPNMANGARWMKECAEDCAAAIRATIKGEKP